MEARLINLQAEKLAAQLLQMENGKIKRNKTWKGENVITIRTSILAVKLKRLQFVVKPL